MSLHANTAGLDESGVRELAERLELAATRLNELHDMSWETTERHRLLGKAQGVRVALSYLEEMTR